MYKAFKIGLGAVLIGSMGLNMLLLERNHVLYKELINTNKEQVVCRDDSKLIEKLRDDKDSLLELEQQMTGEINSLRKQVKEVSDERDLRQHLIDKLNGAPFYESDGTWKVMSFTYNNTTYDDFELTIDDPMEKYRND